MSGMPRQVRKGEPKMVAVGGGTPRRVHSRPNAAMARGCARKKAGSFQILRQELVEIVGGGSAFARLHAGLRRDVVQQAVVGVVDQLMLLPLLHLLNGKAQLLANLVVGMAVEIGDAGMHIDDGGDGAERVLARLLFVVDEALRNLPLIARAADDVDLLVLRLVHAVGARLHRNPGEQLHQPARRDGCELGRGLCGIR